MSSEAVTSAQAKKRADPFAYSDNLKKVAQVTLCILCSCFAVRPSVDTIPNAVRSQLDKNSSRLCAC